MNNNTLELTTFLHSLQKAKLNFEKKSALLLDPDKCKLEELQGKIQWAESSNYHAIFVGGSLVNNPFIDDLIRKIKSLSRLPVILFPGSPLQFTHTADGLLLLSLISGRNADLLIGRHVEVAPLLKQSKVEIIPTGYMLVNSGSPTSASYISQTMPIPANKSEIAVATAQAGELLGLKCIYMDAGSGAQESIPTATIEKVAQGIDIPLIVGGGIRTDDDRDRAFEAGAQLVVMGTRFE